MTLNKYLKLEVLQTKDEAKLVILKKKNINDFFIPIYEERIKNRKELLEQYKAQMNYELSKLPWSNYERI